MKYRPFGRTGFQISEIGFGCGDNGGLMVTGDAGERRAVVEQALAAGINYFDTSNNYGDGRSEVNLGITLREIGAQPFIATKVRLSTADLEDLRAGVRAEFEASLRRLGMEKVDLYYLHTRVAAERRFGGGLPGGPSHISFEDLTGPIWETFLQLRDEGKTRFLGMCTTGAEVPAVKAAMEKLPLDVIQAQYSLLNPTEARRPPPGFQGQDNGQTIELAGQKGIGVTAFRALAAGALAQRPDAAVRPTASRGNATWNADMERARALDFLRSPGETKLAGAAVRYALSNAHVSTVLLGFSKGEYVDEANSYSDAGPLPADVLARIEALYKTDFGRAAS
jgi:L-galactose dehydrogenase/L-glyceraldehyde 3-phosphate reductase